MALKRGRPAPDTSDDGVGRGQPSCFGEAVGRVDGGLFGARGGIVGAYFGGFVQRGAIDCTRPKERRSQLE